MEKKEVMYCLLSGASLNKHGMLIVRNLFSRFIKKKKNNNQLLVKAPLKEKKYTIVSLGVMSN